MTGTMRVYKRDGTLVPFDQSKITIAIEKALLTVTGKDSGLAKRLSDKVVETLKIHFTSQTPNVEQIQDIVEEVFTKTGLKKVAYAYHVYRQRRAEMRRVRSELGIVDELKLTPNALQVLKRRYLLKDETGKTIESTAQIFRRVAKAIAAIDAKYDVTANVPATEEKFYKVMTNLEFIPNSPTLFNAGTKLGQLAACFTLPVEDSLVSIFDAVKNTALIEQSGGGVGFSFSKLRPKGDIVRSTMGVASGPVSFMRVFDVTTEIVKAGGKRRGAMMGILSVEHPDILEFITAKAKKEMLVNFNISVSVTDRFMDAAYRSKDYWLINPRTNRPVKKINAKVVFDLITRSAWQTGDPGLIFVDEINRHNPTPNIGRIEGTNPCITADTWIMTIDGPKKVKDLINKKFTAVVNGQKFESDNGFFCTGKKEVYLLKTREGFEVKLTADHPVHVVKKITRYVLETEWKKLDELRKGDKILLNNHKKVCGWTGSYTEREGYLMGLLVGDGWMTKDKTCLGSWGESEGSVNMRRLAYNFAYELPHRSDFCGWMKPSCEGRYQMRLSCFKDIASSLGLKHGFKTVTEQIESTSSDFYIGFLRGFFDTDGSVQGKQTKGISVRLSQSDLHALKAVQRMLLRLGIFSVIYDNRRKAGRKMLPDGKGSSKEYPIKSQHELVIANENTFLFYQKIGFGDSEKMKKLDDLIKNYKRKINRERFVAVVDEILELSAENVYDAKVNDIHSFDANGFILHNCGEVPLLPYESCNLGSINLSKFVKEGKIDLDRLFDVINIAVHFLDNVIDANVYPLPEIEQITKANRKIGLGVMGFADALFLLGIPYDSKRALAIAEKVMSFISKTAIHASVKLAEKRGPFPNFKDSMWEKMEYKTIRNATLTSIAPTGTLSIIAGCSSGIEPTFAISYVREILEGTNLLEVNPIFEKIIQRHGIYTHELMDEIARYGSIKKIRRIPTKLKKLFVTALDIAPEWHVRMQAAFQKYVHNSVSKTVNLPKDAKPNDVAEIYVLAHKLKCKGITIYRYGSKPEQVLYIGKKFSVKSEYSGGCPTGTCPL